MKKFTANYTYTNPNFVIQNLSSDEINEEILPILYVIKNILQRGFPTIMSKYLQNVLGEIHKFENFEERFIFATSETPKWYNTIKGDEVNDYYPAIDFFENIIPQEFESFSFIQSLIIPEIEINDITGEDTPEFINQQVDFYLPPAKLVIEIDGQQHKYNDLTRCLDERRDRHLCKKGIKTIRITTAELNNGAYKKKIKEIIAYLSSKNNILKYYSLANNKIKNQNYTSEDIETKLIPTAIIRFQILLIELLIHNHLNLNNHWKFNILCHEGFLFKDDFESESPNFVELAVEDLLIWLKNLWQIKHKQILKIPLYNINITDNENEFNPKVDAINIDFSLFKRYTDENKVYEEIIFVRTDYFDIINEKNYFRVSASEPIKYSIIDEDKPILEFFLQNIFDKPNFREGQFPIIANALNLNDTIGLLPTGGGKSICYQLPCLLQPSINFVVCPIKSLMYDQADNLKKIYITNVSYITSDLKKEEKWEIEKSFGKGRFQFVWISPEKFQIPGFREIVASIVSNFSIAYAVIDEVHCLSEWGHDFRTSYLNLAKTIDKLSTRDKNGEGSIKFLGLTATASVNVLKDIKIEFSRQKRSLEDNNIKSLLDYSRKELFFEVINDEGRKMEKLLELIKDLMVDEDFLLINEKAGLIFSPNVNGEYGCYNIAQELKLQFPEKVNWFSGDTPKEPVIDEKTGKKIGSKPIMGKEEFLKHKNKVQQDFKSNKYQLLVATKSFGMGIDKQNIHYTFHYGLPGSVESLYQEAGRAARWDKNNKDNYKKIGKCYVLHSPETAEYDHEYLFNKDTSFANMKKILDKVGMCGNDLFKQLFLFLNGQNDIENDFRIIKKIIDNYFVPKKEVKIFYNNERNLLGIGRGMLEKAIYRLSLLGIVSDWTTDFISHFSVKFNSLDDDSIIHYLSQYISKYDNTTILNDELSKIPYYTTLDKCIYYLLNWTFENIAYHRKQSLKTLHDWCSEFIDSESFKKRIDNYFIFTETTFLIQHIAENPTDYEKWFDVVAPNDKLITKIEFRKLKDSLSRFLESYRNNTGINFLSGFVRLILDDYNDGDGRKRFESALSMIKSFPNPMILIKKLIELGSHLPENQKTELSNSILKFYPEKTRELAESFKLEFLLNDLYEERLKKLVKLNKMLYEQFTKI